MRHVYYDYNSNQLYCMPEFYHDAIQYVGYTNYTYLGVL
jgi:hypothetical protein